MPTIIPEPGKAAEMASLLLKAAGDRPERVRTITTGPSIAFDVDDDLAQAVGAGAPEPKKPARGRPRKMT